MKLSFASQVQVLLFADVSFKFFQAPLNEGLLTRSDKKNSRFTKNQQMIKEQLNAQFLLVLIGMPHTGGEEIKDRSEQRAI